MAGLQGFASHWGCILSRGWLATVEAPGLTTSTHLLLKQGSWLNITKLLTTGTFLFVCIQCMSPTSQANGLIDVFPGGGTKGGEADFIAFLCP